MTNEEITKIVTDYLHRQGVMKSKLAEWLGRDSAYVSRKLKLSNWTLKDYIILQKKGIL